MKPSSPSGTILSLPTTPPSSDQKLAETHPAQLATKTEESQLPVLQIVRKQYILAMNYRTHRLADRSSHYDDTVLSYIANSVKKAKWEIKAHFISRKDPVSIISFLATFELPNNSSKSMEAPQCGIASLRRKDSCKQA